MNEFFLPNRPFYFLSQEIKCGACTYSEVASTKYRMCYYLHILLILIADILYKKASNILYKKFENNLNMLKIKQ